MAMDKKRERGEGYDIVWSTRETKRLEDGGVQACQIRDRARRQNRPDFANIPMRAKAWPAVKIDGNVTSEAAPTP